MASPATTVLDQPDDSQEPELSWETSMANSQGDYWVGDQGVCDLPPILPDNQLGDPTIFGADGEPVDPAPLDDVLVAAAGDENPIHVGNVPWSRGQWELNLAQLMDGLDWSQHYAVGGGFILDFVGPASLNHTPAKCQFPLEIYRVNQCSNDWPNDWEDQNQEEPLSTWEDCMDWSDEWEGQDCEAISGWDETPATSGWDDWVEPPATSGWDDWVETPATSGWDDGIETPAPATSGWDDGIETPAPATSGWEDWMGSDDWAGWDGDHDDPNAFPKDHFISDLEKALDTEIQDPYTGYSALMALFVCFY